jgi:hypothetical protein
MDNLTDIYYLQKQSVFTAHWATIKRVQFEEIASVTQEKEQKKRGHKT